MSIVTPTFVADLKTNASEIAQETYDGLVSDLWWERVANTMPSVSKKERIVLAMATAQIEQLDTDLGNLVYEDAFNASTEVENTGAGVGLAVKKTDLEDLDGGILGGLGQRNVGAWARSVGEQAAYWPQNLIAKAMRDNTAVGFDGKVLFASDHPVHPGDLARGVYSNDFTGAASGLYPGALPIHESSVTVEVALQNLMKAKAYIGTVKHANGRDPRRLQIAAIIVPPALEARASLLCGAEFIAQAGSSGAISGDIRPITGRLKLGAPIVAAELGSDQPGGSDTTYYLVVRRTSNADTGGLVYVNRQPFEMSYIGPETDEALRAANELRWQTQGRNAVTVGLPYMIFRCRAT